MQELIKKIRELEDSKINILVEKRLKEFEAFKNKSNNEWFQELCFCILAANSKQKTSQLIQESLNNKLLTIEEKELAQYIRDNKHRFHNNKAKYIVEARKYKDIKEILKNKNEIESRNFLVKNIKGIGMKEASHFLRNIGFSQNLAILDRHILSVMHEHAVIDSIPKSITHNNYLNIETKFSNLAKQLNISPAKLDLFLWYLKTGKVAK